ncbi:nitroreductase family protein [Litchfieldia salsa]|uniref:Putative TM nitroreductase n=1 Tax=Litchfieldia salsa TaxID=930152 RepID=A0A1H0UT78_9BACI|nr:nitroreductase family protein [Litchfieldia salsa]SDP69108.1 Putative TM nitroreductase [Litchfieldia salsa]
MNYKKSVIDTMSKRQSIRTYDSKDLTISHDEKLNEYLRIEQNLIGPFGRRGRIELIQVKNNVTDKGIKLGTYGFIKNPKGFLVGLAENNKYSLVEFGYIFQKLVLYLTELEIGSCWMGGTFQRNSFEKEIVLYENEFIPCITPFGYAKEKQRMFDKALRIVVKADNKKSWEKLFYDTTFENSLLKENAGHLEIPIEMVRLGPSASNKQPWRIVLSQDRNTCHFFIEHTPNYSSSLGYDMQLLDLGIAMCQFDLACKELSIEGSWVIENPQVNLPNEETEYIASWKNN